MKYKDEFLARMHSQRPENWKRGYNVDGRCCALDYTVQGKTTKARYFGLTLDQIEYIITINDSSDTMKQAHKRIEAYIEGLEDET